MPFNFKNFINPENKHSKMRDFQDLDHLEGVSVSAISAGLYDDGRDDITLFYFNDGAKFATIHTKSKIVGENIKFNLQQKNKIAKALFVNTKNANVFTGKQGIDSLKELSKNISKELTLRASKLDIGTNDVVKPNQIIFASTGVIGEKYPLEEIRKNIPDLVDKLKNVQNKYIWLKAASAIKTTDLVPKVVSEECEIDNKIVKIENNLYGADLPFLLNLEKV